MTWGKCLVWGEWYWGRNDYDMGAKRPRVEIEAKRHGRGAGGNDLGAKRLVCPACERRAFNLCKQSSHFWLWAGQNFCSIWQMFELHFDHDIDAVSVSFSKIYRCIYSVCFKISHWCLLFAWVLCHRYRIVQIHFTYNPFRLTPNSVLETAGPIVAKSYATKYYLWQRNSSLKNEFGRPNLGLGHCIFSAYLRTISEINLFKTAQRSWSNNIVFLLMDAGIILTGSLWFSDTCCLFLFSKKHFREPDLGYD